MNIHVNTSVASVSRGGCYVAAEKVMCGAKECRTVEQSSLAHSAPSAVQNSLLISQQEEKHAVNH